MKTTTRCPTCRTTWTGLRTCHCSRCCCTFSGFTAFDRHQRGGKCLNPATVALMEFGGVWSYPAPDQPVWEAPRSAIF
jgi:hypothetical protein